MRCNVTVCLFAFHRVQYWNGLQTSMMYLPIVHSSCVVQIGQYSLYITFWSHSQPNSHDWQAPSSNSSVEFHSVLTSLVGSTTMQTFTFWQSMNSFQQPGVSVFNTASILCYMKISFMTLKISWNTFLFDFLRYTCLHGELLIHSSIALVSKSLTLSNGYAFNLRKLLSTLMGFPRLGAAFNTKTAHEYT